MVYNIMSLELVADEVGKMITMDGLNDSVKTDLVTLVKLVLSKEQYVNSVKARINDILADKAITVADIPNIIMLSLQVNAMLPQLLGLTNSILASKVKYIVYGSVYFYIVQNKASFFTDTMTVDVFRMMFSSMWTLVEINPANVVLLAKSCCCGETPVKTSAPVANEPTATKA